MKLSAFIKKWTLAKQTLTARDTTAGIRRKLESWMKKVLVAVLRPYLCLCMTEMHGKVKVAVSHALPRHTGEQFPANALTDQVIRGTPSHQKGTLQNRFTHRSPNMSQGEIWVSPQVNPLP